MFSTTKKHTQNPDNLKAFV